LLEGQQDKDSAYNCPEGIYAQKQTTQVTLKIYCQKLCAQGIKTLNEKSTLSVTGGSLFQV